MIRAHFIVICLITMIGCSHQSLDEASLNDVIKRFPQLNYPFLQKQSNNYHLVRSVSLEKPGATIKLYSQPDSMEDIQQIILITNSSLQSYAIPFFSNTYRDYWNFQLDDLSGEQRTINTTFERELNACIDRLGLIDTLGTSGKVADEILRSLLHCSDLSIYDSANFKVIHSQQINSLPEENTDSCFTRLQSIWDRISLEMIPNKYIINKQAYWDKVNERVYQFDFEGFKRKKKNYFKLNIFRTNCSSHSFPTL